ncbi:MAG: hypothetical protein KC501_19060 [Myxococcales bacterium]|nr:hypothetical protein [Myxococcales bacterium]
MSTTTKLRLLKGVLLVGAVAGFGSEIGRCHRGYAHADELTRVCVDAALGRDHGEYSGWHGHRARWVAERCAEHARDAGPP